MHTVIGVDVGTTHIKSILYLESGFAIKEEKTDTPLRADKQGNLYFAEEIWQIVKGQIERLLQCREGKIAGIAITGMAEAGLVVDKKAGTPLSDILPWFDGRTSGLADEIGEKAERELFKSTGLRNSYKYGIYKFLWLLKNRELNKETCLWLSMCDYIAYRLTGKFVTDPTFAARTYAYDISAGKWDEKHLAQYGLRTDNFPEVVPSGKVFGACKLFDGEIIPVAICGHDHVCAAYGLLAGRTDAICDSAGTAETYIGRIAPSEKKEFDFESGAVYGPFVDKGWFYMLNIPSSGHSLEWYRKKLMPEELSYEKLNQAMESEGRKPTDILYFPWLTGTGSPWYASDMKAAFIGIKESDDGGKIIKAIAEGIQYQAAWLLSMMESVHGGRKNILICAGGQTKNSVLMQLKADILNKTVYVPRESEATLGGAAALFIHKNLGEKTGESFLQRLMDPVKCYEPDPELAKAYEKIVQGKFLPIATILKKCYQIIWRE